MVESNPKPEFNPKDDEEPNNSSRGPTPIPTQATASSSTLANLQPPSEANLTNSSIAIKIGADLDLFEAQRREHGSRLGLAPECDQSPPEGRAAPVVEEYLSILGIKDCYHKKKDCSHRGVREGPSSAEEEERKEKVKNMLGEYGKMMSKLHGDDVTTEQIQTTHERMRDLERKFSLGDMQYMDSKKEQKGKGKEEDSPNGGVNPPAVAVSRESKCANLGDNYKSNDGEEKDIELTASTFGPIQSGEAAQGSSLVHQAHGFDGSTYNEDSGDEEGLYKAEDIIPHHRYQQVRNAMRCASTGTAATLTAEDGSKRTIDAKTAFKHLSQFTKTYVHGFPKRDRLKERESLFEPARTSTPSLGDSFRSVKDDLSNGAVYGNQWNHGLTDPKIGNKDPFTSHQYSKPVSSYSFLPEQRNPNSQNSIGTHTVFPPPGLHSGIANEAKVTEKKTGETIQFPSHPWSQMTESKLSSIPSGEKIAKLSTAEALFLSKNEDDYFKLKGEILRSGLGRTADQAVSATNKREQMPSLSSQYSQLKLKPVHELFFDFPRFKGQEEIATVAHGKQVAVDNFAQGRERVQKMMDEVCSDDSSVRQIPRKTLSSQASFNPGFKATSRLLPPARIPSPSFKEKAALGREMTWERSLDDCSLYDQCPVGVSPAQLKDASTSSGKLNDLIFPGLTETDQRLLDLELKFSQAQISSFDQKDEIIKQTKQIKELQYAFTAQLELTVSQQVQIKEKNDCINSLKNILGNRTKEIENQLKKSRGDNKYQLFSHSRAMDQLTTKLKALETENKELSEYLEKREKNDFNKMMEDGKKIKLLERQHTMGKGYAKTMNSINEELKNEIDSLSEKYKQCCHAHEQVKQELCRMQRMVVVRDDDLVRVNRADAEGPNEPEIQIVPTHDEIENDTLSVVSDSDEELLPAEPIRPGRPSRYGVIGSNRPSNANRSHHQTISTLSAGGLTIAEHIEYAHRQQVRPVPLFSPGEQPSVEHIEYAEAAVSPGDDFTMVSNQVGLREEQFQSDEELYRASAGNNVTAPRERRRS